MASPNTQQLRQRLAQEAARLMMAEGIHDYQWAKEKAAANLGVRDKRCLPQNTEIDDAAREYLRLFAGDGHAKRLSRLRRIGAQAMRYLDAFHPLLAGAAASGTVGPNTPVRVELYVDRLEDVLQRLHDGAIPYTQQELAIRDKAGVRVFPKISFLAESVPVELVVFPAKLRWQKPGDKDTARLTLAQLQALMSAEPCEDVARGPS